MTTILRPALFHPELAARVRSQADLLPDVYGDLDFDTPPYRQITEPGEKSSLPRWVADSEELFADAEAVELMATTTMLGDVAADPYAALTADHSVTDLIRMLVQACKEGIDSVPDAPPELARFIEAMEETPDWIDMDLVAEGARQARVSAALLEPFITRGAFLGTFTNTYAALPMALTGALTGKRAARRVNETANFFAVTTLPGAMDRGGQGFVSAAMVRLMHSMVRYNALKRSTGWDAEIYGMPVPQVDQMPAGLMGQYMMSRRILADGKTEYTDAQRALVEFGRYRCFLLGLPEELVPDTPQRTVQLMHLRAAMLRDGFDDATCGELVRSTMAAYLRPGESRFDRIANAVEKSYSSMAFMAAFCAGNRNKAKRMGVDIDAADFLRVGVTAPFILGRFFGVGAANKTPLAPLVDLYLIQMIKLRLATYGNPEFRTDAAEYSPKHKH